MSPSTSPGGRSKRRRSAGQPNAAAATARAKLRAEQAAAQRRRRQRLFVIVPIAVVLVIIGAFAIVRFATQEPAPTSSADAGVIRAATSVPVDVLNQVGPGTIATPPRRIEAPALVQDGKPKILYVGAEYCPFCAAERWPVVVALSRFGTFSGLGSSTSSSRDVYPSTPSLSFHGSSYSSTVIAFTGAEMRSSEYVDGQYAPLDTLTAEDQQTFDTYNAPPYVEGQGGAIPFVDIGGRYVINGSSYDPQLLQGRTHAEIAAALSDPNSDIGKAVNGSANVITAAVCATTNNQPSAVCESAGVTAARAELP